MKPVTINSTATALDVSDLTAANIEAVENGQSMPYTKKQHSTARNFDYYEAQSWNECLPGAEQYTEIEIENYRRSKFGLELIELNADLMRSLNISARDHGKPIPYTKQDHKNAVGLAVGEMRAWNECLPELEQYTNAEINK